MVYDFHTHTSLSDGELSPSELIYQGYNKGYRVICITDHAGVGYSGRVIAEVAKDCDAAMQSWDIVAISGIELTYLPPQAIADAAKQAKQAGAKIVVVHGETISENVGPGTNLAAVSCPDVDILAHPGLITVEEAELAAKNGVYLEISARKGHCLTNGHVAKVANTAGAKLILNSDSHTWTDLLTADKAKAVAKGAGLEDIQLDEVLITNPQELLKRIGG
ncbi:MAG: histidinol phosphate phosphatase domain-containing protein [Chloroflexi bacterium]|jgi:putative hydrolase|nr:histidinol phosphate phosphatase domain-containing protein [Chloroflexota bacterium]MBT7082202.1 histidinol phosphate phosphatase domain-containing protein [Chloroflexota bacterium]MBT7289903.1 histidinol phosphate phosphatase domain-containing protein [Chloroflexota bacterium]